MGLYYNPNPPHIGAPQPLEQRKLTPPQSGPTPQNPPFRGSRIGQDVLVSWAVAAVVAATLIVLPTKLVPAQAAVSTPLFANPNYQILRAWDPVAPAPIVAINLDPPVSGPTPQNPPVIGTRVPLPVQIAWLPPPPAPITAVNLDPPVSGPTPQNPPIVGARLPLPVQIGWIPPPPAPITAINLDPPASGPTPQNPPTIGSVVPAAVHVAWLPLPPAPIVAVNLDPPASGPTPSNPSFRGGARVPNEVLIAWLPPVPAPIVARNLIPPVSGPAVNNPPFAGASVPLAVQLGWLPSVPAPIVGQKSVFAAVVNNPPLVGATIPVAVQVSWLPTPIAPIVGPKFTPGGIAPSNPPFTGPRGRLEVQISWLREIFVGPLQNKWSAAFPAAPPPTTTTVTATGGGTYLTPEELAKAKAYWRELEENDNLSRRKRKKAEYELTETIRKAYLRAVGEEPELAEEIVQVVAQAAPATVKATSAPLFKPAVVVDPIDWKLVAQSVDAMRAILQVMETRAAAQAFELRRQIELERIARDEEDAEILLLMS